MTTTIFTNASTGMMYSKDSATGKTTYVGNAQSNTATLTTSSTAKVSTPTTTAAKTTTATTTTKTADNGKILSDGSKILANAFAPTTKNLTTTTAASTAASVGGTAISLNKTMSAELVNQAAQQPFIVQVPSFKSNIPATPLIPALTDSASKTLVNPTTPYANIDVSPIKIFDVKLPNITIPNVGNSIKEFIDDINPFNKLGAEIESSTAKWTKVALLLGGIYVLSKVD